PWRSIAKVAIVRDAVGRVGLGQNFDTRENIILLLAHEDAASGVQNDLATGDLPGKRRRSKPIRQRFLNSVKRARWDQRTVRRLQICVEMKRSAWGKADGQMVRRIDPNAETKRHIHYHVRGSAR